VIYVKVRAGKDIMAVAIVFYTTP